MLKIVKTENGLVHGVSGNNARITAFKGIPFAAPPTEENRWSEPKPCKNWDGVLKAYSFAPIPMQDTPGLSDDLYCKEFHVNSNVTMSEDCLYLNVWTPANSSDDKLPVLVWIFGGAFQWGYTSEMEFNGENIAKRGIVVVSIAYRLGAFGFLAHESLTREVPLASTNFGLLDQRAGLNWVQRNIAAFGGDPDNVTLSGQSAGGASVLSHLTSKESFGLYNKAIIYSGIFRNPYNIDEFITPQPLSSKEALGQKFLNFLGVTSIDEARRLDAFFIRDKYAEFAQANPRFAPCIDGAFNVDDPFKLFLAGKHADVPILAGNTFDEFLDYIAADSDIALSKEASRIFGDKAAKFLAFDEVKSEFNNNFACPVRAIELSSKALLGTSAKPCYYYSFEADIPGEDKPGCFHSVDLWFFFETLAASYRGYTGKHYDLSRQMCNYISNFIKTGNPNGVDVDGNAMPNWLPYSNEEKNEMHFTMDGPAPSVNSSKLYDFLIKHIVSQNRLIKKQAVNPYLPPWEYIPDGEPYVFGDRVYVYGSHDFFNGHAFCLGDYVCYSAPVDDLSAWRYEGVIYKRTQDPENSKNNMCLYAPDVTVGPDGRYYLYYVLDKISIVSVAVCDSPAGSYEFLGYVHYPDGTRLGEKATDEPQFDPGVITINDKTYLYTGFCGHGDKSRSGAMVTVLASDMLTVLEAPKIIVPGGCYSDDTPYKGHGFFEAPSIRAFDNTYYFIYSSQLMHELCYATSKSPLGPFEYGGVIVSNADMNIDSYKEASKPTAFGANNHGSLIEIAGKRYIFYHRHTNNTWYSRQGCIEPVVFRPDGSILQSEITSSGPNNGPLNDREVYPSYIACNLFNESEDVYLGNRNNPMITQEGKDGDRNPGYIAQITEGTTIGFKYFACEGVVGFKISARGYATGGFDIRTSLNGNVLGRIDMEYSTVWEDYSVACSIPDGVNAIYLTFTGDGTAELKSIEFLH